MKNSSGRIFDAAKIKHCIQRIAYQIYETNFSRDEIFIVGIASNGETHARLLQKQLEKISPLNVTFVQLTIDKKNPQTPIQSSIALSEMKDQSVVVVDDVLNTGSTLMYAVKFMLDVPLAQLNTAVLVNRNHKKYPIKADFKGVSLSTSVNEHVEVCFEGDHAGVYLS